jgi:hypothetical protein
MDQDWLSTYLPYSREQACAVRYDRPGRMRSSRHLNDALLKIDYHDRRASRIEFKIAHCRIPFTIQGYSFGLSATLCLFVFPSARPMARPKWAVLRLPMPGKVCRPHTRHQQHFGLVAVSSRLQQTAADSHLDL